MFAIKIKIGLASSIIPKNVLPKLQTENDLEVVLTPNTNSVEVGEVNKKIYVKVSKKPELKVPRKTEKFEIRYVENIIPARTQKNKQHREESRY